MAVAIFRGKAEKEGDCRRGRSSGKGGGNM